MTIVSQSNITPEGFETYAEAKDRRAYKIMVLGGGNKAQRQLAAELGRCRKLHRCQLGACDVCNGLFRLYLFRELQPILASRLYWTGASVVTSDLLFEEGTLAAADLDKIRKMIAKRFERWSLRNRIIIAGIDISCNLEDNEKIGWQLHLYMLIEGEQTVQLEEAVKATFRPELTASVPYKFTQVTSRVKAVTYLYKAIFWRRSRYTVSSTGRHQTKRQPLKRPELTELLEFLGRYPVDARLILHGIRRNGGHFVISNKSRSR